METVDGLLLQNVLDYVKYSSHGKIHLNHRASTVQI